MSTNIKLGFRDIQKNIKFIFVTTIFLVALSFISMVILHTVTILSQEQDYGMPMSYKIIYSEYNFQADEKIIDDLSALFNEKGVSYQFSNSLSEANGVPIDVLFGNPEILGVKKIPESDIYAFSLADSTIESVLYDNTEIPVLRLDGESSYLIVDTIYIVFNGDKLKDVLMKYYDHDFSYVVSVLENTYIMSSDFEAYRSLESIVDDISGISLKGKLNYEVNSSDSNFIYFYLVPLFFIMFLVFVMSYLNLQKETILKKQKELIIHSLHGATFNALTVRFMISTLIPIIISFVISLYISRGLEHRCLLLLTSYGSTVFLMIFYIIRVLKALNLNDNIRGDLQ